MEADILQLAARAYQKLMTVEYQVVLGRKGKAHTIEIAFRADNFYHLAGLHKLKQRYPFQQQTSKCEVVFISGKAGKPNWSLS